jgi:hypothetical protein
MLFTQTRFLELTLEAQPPFRFSLLWLLLRLNLLNLWPSRRCRLQLEWIGNDRLTIFIDLWCRNWRRRPSWFPDNAGRYPPRQFIGKVRGGLTGGAVHPAASISYAPLRQAPKHDADEDDDNDDEGDDRKAVKTADFWLIFTAAIEIDRTHRRSSFKSSFGA